MKRLSVRILRLIGYILSFVYTDRIGSALGHIRDKIYTGFLSRRLGSLGDSIIMWHPYTLRGIECVSIGDNTIIEPDIQLTTAKLTDVTPRIRIGSGCLIRRGAHITAINSITIGDNLLTGTNVIITDNSHGNTDYETLCQPATRRTTVSKGPVIIGDNVWLGNNVCVMPGVTIGTGVIVGANSVVTHDIPDYCVVAGVPAKCVKEVLKSNE